jgi:hypothetical protein
MRLRRDGGLRLAAAFGLWLFLSGLAPGAARAGELPKPGDTLPQITLQTPVAAEDRTALGLPEGAVFRLGDVDAQCVLFEVIGVYCVECHKQAPLFDKLHARLAKDPALSGRVRMVAMAAGATDKEVEYLRKKGAYPFPVVNDPQYEAHKALGEPKTPFTMLVARDGKVVYAHLGVITDTAGFYREIETLCR